MKKRIKVQSRKTVESNPHVTPFTPAEKATINAWRSKRGRSADPKANFAACVAAAKRYRSCSQQTAKARFELLEKVFVAVGDALAADEIAELRNIAQAPARTKRGTKGDMFHDLIRRLCPNVSDSTVTKWAYNLRLALHRGCKPGEIGAFIKKGGGMALSHPQRSGPSRGMSSDSKEDRDAAQEAQA